MEAIWWTTTAKVAICHQKQRKRLVLNSVENTNFVIVLLRRSVFGDEGNRIIKNKINAVDDLRLM